MNHRPHKPCLLLEPLEPRQFLTTTTFTFTSLASFKAKTTGAHPSGLIVDANGNIFGTTTSGGSKGYGTLFEIPASTGTLITLASFTGANGIAPRGTLVLDSSGNIFGTTVGGGTKNKGTIFKFSPGTSSTLTAVASFNGVNGSYPLGGLVADSAGNLFGTALGSGESGFRSTVFEVASGSSAITVLATIKPSTHVGDTLVVDSSGDIFGTTTAGGTSGKGSIFKIAGSAHTFTTLASFTGNLGSKPAGLVADGSGNLIGLTNGGGTNGRGTLFRFNVTASSITTIATFNGTNGSRPIGNLIVDGSGNVFGVTANGGSKSVGTIFEWTSGTSQSVTTLFTFKGDSTGFNPTGAFLADNAGNFFGGTFQGGAQKSNAGTVFQLHDDSFVFSPPPTPTLANIVPASSAPLTLVVTQ